jgi:hypothetical protein
VKKHLSLSSFAAVAAAAVLVSIPRGDAAHAQMSAAAFDAPAVFQAAGPNIASIQGTIDQYRLAIGGINNGNAPGPLASGRREINWDGGGSTATSPGPTPFLVFLNTRGAFIETPGGTGFVQAPLDGLVTTFGNPSYATTFQPFSPVRLFSAIGSRITEVTFFIPGGSGAEATTRGFGAIFSDVDQPDGDAGTRRVDAKGSTLIRYLGRSGEVLYSTHVPASPGNASLSFLGILFDDPRIARVVIFAGNANPGKNDAGGTDIVMMDDFIYAEPQAK